MFSRITIYSDTIWSFLEVVKTRYKYYHHL